GHQQRNSRSSTWSSSHAGGGGRYHYQQDNNSIIKNTNTPTGTDLSPSDGIDNPNLLHRFCGVDGCPLRRHALHDFCPPADDSNYCENCLREAPLLAASQ
ncbi:unnamed protein product, partial [Amoebophrya sp. A25]